MSSAFVDDRDNDEKDWRTPESVYNAFQDSAVFGEPRRDEAGRELCPLCSKPTGMDVLNPMVHGSYGGVNTKCLECFWGMHYRALR